MNAKILIVDDHPLLREGLQRVIGSEEGLAICGLASSVREALTLTEATSPDLVITDIQLPHVSGLELIRMLRADAELSEVPIMAVTAYAAQGDEERIRGAGAQSYVSKPISVLKFVAAVEELLPKEDAGPGPVNSGGKAPAT